jgi:hypothetical protein
MKSMFTTQNDEQMLKTVRAVRVMPGLAMVLVALALFVFKQSPRHDFCLGAALGVLIGYSLFAIQIKRVDLEQTPQPSDVTRHRLT